MRELKNLIERIMILENTEIIEMKHLPCDIDSSDVRYKRSDGKLFLLPEEGINIEDVEKELVREALERTGWNQSKAAKLLGLSRDAFRYRMQKFGLLKQE